ncbi:MAG: hypothetical protein IPK14_15720 [Blastocatellia bacterium]|nr:hypothetical protein [Blastocatellia bacterium]
MVNNVKIGTDGLLWVLLNDLRVALINPNTLQTITTFTLPANPRSILLVLMEIVLMFPYKIAIL